MGILDFGECLYSPNSYSLASEEICLPTISQSRHFLKENQSWGQRKEEGK